MIPLAPLSAAHVSSPTASSTSAPEMLRSRESELVLA